MESFNRGNLFSQTSIIEDNFVCSSPRQVRKHIDFSSPSKMSSTKYDKKRLDMMQFTPAPKMSKSKMLKKLEKNQRVLDFDSDKLTEDPSTDLFSTKISKVNEELADLNLSARKQNLQTPIFESKSRRYLDSTACPDMSGIKMEISDTTPFSKKLNDSDSQSIEKYQALAFDEGREMNCPLLDVC